MITVEHLLSYEIWKQIKCNGWSEFKKKSEIMNMFSNVIDLNKSAECVIEEIVDNTELKESIIYWMPKDEKKEQILKLVRGEVEKGNYSVIEGFKNTISLLEKEFG